MKKILCIIMSVFILMGSLCVCVSAQNEYEAYIDDTGYVSFKDAVNAANSSDKSVIIRVAKSFIKTGDNSQYELEKPMTIDFCSHEMTLDGNQAFLVTADVEITIKNGSLKTNFIGTQSRYIFKTSSTNATLNLTDFTVKMNNVTPQTGASLYAEKGTLNLNNVTYNYISQRTSYGAMLGASGAGILTAKNCVFNCNYSTPLAYFASASAAIHTYNSTFNKVNDYTLCSQVSRISDIEEIVPSGCTLSWNAYNSGFSTVCAHSFGSDNICVNCGSEKKNFGDANGDETVDVKDALTLKRYFAGFDEQINLANARVTNNSILGLRDLLKIKKYLVGEVVQLDPVLDVNTDNGDVVKTIHFQYSTPNYNGSEALDRGAIMLPKGYTKTGASTRLVIDVHGYSGVIDERNTYADNSVYSYISSFVHNGFAVLSVQSLSAGHCAGQYAIKAIVNAYKYVVAQYNIASDGVYVNGNSMGGISSINLVCSGEIPVLAQTLHYPITSTYRQTYTNGWIDGLRASTARYSGFSFDEYNAANGTSYTLSSFPFTNSKNSPSQAELDLYRYNFFENIANKYSIFRYTNIINDEQNDFNPDFSEFLTEFDSGKVDAMYEKITVNYPVPVFFTQCLNDTDKNVWAQKLVKAMQRGDSSVTYKWYEGTKHGGSIGPEITFTTKDGTSMTTFESAYTLAKYYVDFEASLSR